MEIISWIDKGISYIQIGLDWVRNIVDKVAGWLPFETSLITTILFLLLSLWLGQTIAKKFTTKPLSMPYVIWTIVIAISIFLNLVYL